MALVLIVDDDSALRDSLAETLADLGHTPLTAPDGAAALALLDRQRVAAVLLDLRMPGMDGLEVLRRIRARPDPPPVAVLTAVPTAANTIEAMRLGAADHLAKPIGRTALAALVARMLPAEAPAVPAAAPALASAGTDGLIGNSAPMREVQKAIGLLADSDATVLITGESGTGKEVVARALHRHGRRGGKPFVAVNCAAIPEALLESTLFGHVRGAFTGAVADRPGSFREAEGGTLFLDEIGDMAPALQAKLLRVLQEREVTPVGGRAVAIDVRVLAATHRDLRALIAEGRFREDLFWRIGVVPLALPPLRERRQDILPIAESFLAEAGGTHRLGAGATTLLVAHPWPGNVRELRNAIARAAALARHTVLDEGDFAFLGAESGPKKGESAKSETLRDAVARLEQGMIRRALTESGSRAEAARRLGITRQLLYDKLRRYGMDVSDNTTDDVVNSDTS